MLYLEISQVEERVILFVLCEAHRTNIACSEHVDVYDAVITSLEVLLVSCRRSFYLFRLLHLARWFGKVFRCRCCNNMQFTQALYQAV